MRMPIATAHFALVSLAAPIISVARPVAAQSSRLVVADGGRVFATPNMRAFEERRAAGFGHFVSDSVLRAAAGKRLSHVLMANVPSLFFGAGGSGAEFLISSRVCGAGISCSSPRCYVRVFIDGAETFDGTTSMRDLTGVDISHMRPEDFSGIEYYSGAAGLPAKYVGQNADCGTLLMWSREP